VSTKGSQSTEVGTSSGPSKDGSDFVFRPSADIMARADRGFRLISTRSSVTTIRQDYGTTTVLSGAGSRRAATLLKNAATEIDSFSVAQKPVCWNVPRSRKQRSDAFKRLRDLETYPMVESWIVAGVLPRTVAMWLQAQGHLLDIKEASITRTLERLRESLVLDAEERSELLDELQELIGLVRINGDRIEENMRVEVAIGRLIPATTEMIRAQVELLTKIHGIKKRLGVHRHLTPQRGQP
jgi:hypothetical protein